MKKILIVDKSFAVGGIQTALINMVKELKKKYDVDVLMFYNNGVLKKYFPDDVKIIEPFFLLKVHGMNVSDAKSESLGFFLLRLLTGVFDKCFTNRFSIWFAILFQQKLYGYDAAIAFHHEAAIRATVSGFYRFVKKKVDAPVKLGWIHYDPERIPFNDKANEKYMRMMDKIVCVSKGTEDKFLKYHLSFKGKTDFCYNMQDIDRILSLSHKATAGSLSENAFNCFSACRFGPQKAIPRAVKAIAPVLKKHPDIHWYVAGDGEDMPEVRRLIAELALTDSVTLLGSLANPYPYFSKCDLYIQPSIYEAAPMVYGEAMICKIPILTTDNISAAEMVPKEYGMICENSEEGLRSALMYLAENRELVREMKANLEKQQYSNEGILDKIDSMLNIG